MPRAPTMEVDRLMGDVDRVSRLDNTQLDPRVRRRIYNVYDQATILSPIRPTAGTRNTYTASSTDEKPQTRMPVLTF